MREPPAEDGDDQGTTHVPSPAPACAAADNSAPPVLSHVCTLRQHIQLFFLGRCRGRMVLLLRTSRGHRLISHLITARTHEPDKFTPSSSPWSGPGRALLINRAVRRNRRSLLRCRAPLHPVIQNTCRHPTPVTLPEHSPSSRPTQQRGLRTRIRRHGRQTAGIVRLMGNRILLSPRPVMKAAARL